MKTPFVPTEAQLSGLSYDAQLGIISDETGSEIQYTFSKTTKEKLVKLDSGDPDNPEWISYSRLVFFVVGIDVSGLKIYRWDRDPINNKMENLFPLKGVEINHLSHIRYQGEKRRGTYKRKQQLTNPYDHYKPKPLGDL